MARKPVHDPTEWFTAARAARLSDLTFAMVNYLSRAHIIEPSCSCKRGHGRKRHYSFGDVVALRLVKQLSATGVRPLRLQKALRGFRKFHEQITPTTLPASHVVTDGVDLYLRNDADSIERIFDGQFAFAFVVELAPLQAEVAKRLKRYAGSDRYTSK